MDRSRALQEVNAMIEELDGACSDQEKKDEILERLQSRRAKLEASKANNLKFQLQRK